MNSFQPKQILVPTDFSDLATRALEYAKVIAEKFGSRMTLVYADTFLPPPYITSSQMDRVTQEIDKSKRFARQELANYASLYAEGVAIDPIVAEGTPVAAILEVAAKTNADLIVMGTHGRGGFNRVMLGSVTERVLREAIRPVLAVRAVGHHAEDEPPAIRHILCPVNFTEVAHESLDDALALGAALDAEVTVLNVVEEGNGDGAANREEIEQWVRSNPSCATVTFRHMVLHGNAPEQIITYAQQEHIDLIVIGAQHKRFFDTTILGSTTVSIIRHAPCPVLTIVRQAAETSKSETLTAMATT